MALAKSDVFDFDAASWLARPSIQALPLDEQGAVVRMLCFDWLNGGIEPRHLPGLLGLERGRVLELVQGLVGELFDYRQSDGRLVAIDLEAQRTMQLARSIKSAESARSRWKPKRAHSDRTKDVSEGNATALVAVRPKRQRFDGKAELKKGIEAWELENGPMPDVLKKAAEAYRVCRVSSRYPLYKAEQWRKNLCLQGTGGSAFTASDMVEALNKSVASGWRSVNPRCSGGAKTNRFAALEVRDARG